jgi:hypothetical protein
MKFIIKEDRLLNIIFKFLDSNINLFEGDDGWYGESDSKYYELVFNERWNTLFVSFDLIHRIQNFFTLDYIDSKTIISSWFEQKTGKTSREVIGNPKTAPQFRK